MKNTFSNLFIAGLKTVIAIERSEIRESVLSYRTVTKLTFRLEEDFCVLPSEELKEYLVIVLPPAITKLFSAHKDASISETEKVIKCFIENNNNYLRELIELIGKFDNRDLTIRIESKFKQIISVKLILGIEEIVVYEI